MTDLETAHLESVKGYLDELGLRYSCRQHNPKRCRSDIVVALFDLGIKLSNDTDFMYRRRHYGRPFLILKQRYTPGQCVRQLEKLITLCIDRHKQDQGTFPRGIKR